MRIETCRNHGRLYVVRGAACDNQAITRLDHLWPEFWSSVSKAAQRKEKQQWTIEKTKLNNARTLRGICFIDPYDKEFTETS